MSGTTLIIVILASLIVLGLYDIVLIFIECWNEEKENKKFVKTYCVKLEKDENNDKENM